MAWAHADPRIRIRTEDQEVRNLDAQLTAWRRQIEDVLDGHLPVRPPAALIEAGRHGLLGNGKRVRALLVLACTHDLECDTRITMSGACAIEMVHAASLILDDMPCMDDALHRRGCKTTHRAYGQSTAILSAIGLIALAFELIGSDPHLASDVRATMVEELARAIGYAGLTGGQHDDLFATLGSNGSENLNDLYMRKTGALYSLSLTFGGLAAALPPHQLETLSSAGSKLGVAFQLLDDLLDACGTRETVGKDVGKDVAKTTAVSLYGVTGTMEEADRLTSEVRTTIAEALGHNATYALICQISDQAAARMVKDRECLSASLIGE